MAISGSGGWIPSARCCIRERRLLLGKPFHNVHPLVVWQPEYAAAHFVDDPKAYIYVPLADNGGVQYLSELLVEMDIIDPV